MSRIELLGSLETVASYYWSAHNMWRFILKSDASPQYAAMSAAAQENALRCERMIEKIRARGTHA